MIPSVKNSIAHCGLRSLYGATVAGADKTDVPYTVAITARRNDCRDSTIQAPNAQCDHHIRHQRVIITFAVTTIRKYVTVPKARGTYDSCSAHRYRRL